MGEREKVGERKRDMRDGRQRYKHNERAKAERKIK